MNIKDEFFDRIIIVGGGAAGLLAAGFAARESSKSSPKTEILIIEKNARMARKVMITGKGRCNVTNLCEAEEFIKNVPTNGKFLYSVISGFSPKDTMMLLEQNGVPLKVERGNRVFPMSDRAVDVVDGLVKFAKSGGAKFLQGTVTELLIENGECKGVVVDGKKILAKTTILATGGKSYPLTGSDGGGYLLAEKAGHTIISPVGSLVPLEATSSWCMDLQGLSLKNCGLQLVKTTKGKKKTVFKDFGEMLFTHFGVSGPIILSASAHVKDSEKFEYELIIDLKPALSPEKLDERVLRDIGENINKSFINMLGGLLPKTMCPVFCRLVGISPAAKCNSISKEERQRICETLKALKIGVLGKRPIEEAIVTSGGVSIKEIDSKTMKSKLVSGLSFAGEIIDVDAYTGGFNLQIAFSTGAAAGRFALE